jgi:hypothetical protein
MSEVVDAVVSEGARLFIASAGAIRAHESFDALFALRVLALGKFHLDGVLGCP